MAVGLKLPLSVRFDIQDDGIVYAVARIGQRDVLIATCRKDVLDRDQILWKAFQAMMLGWAERLARPDTEASTPEAARGN